MQRQFSFIALSHSLSLSSLKHFTVAKHVDCCVCVFTIWDSVRRCEILKGFRTVLRVLFLFMTLSVLIEFFSPYFPHFNTLRRKTIRNYIMNHLLGNLLRDTSLKSHWISKCLWSMRLFSLLLLSQFPLNPHSLGYLQFSRYFCEVFLSFEL